MPGRFQTSSVLFPAALGLCPLAALVLWAWEPIVSVACIGSMAPILLAWWASINAAWGRLVLGVVAALGMVLQFNWLNAAYVLCIDAPQGRHPEVTAGLGAIMAWSIAAGAALAMLFLDGFPSATQARRRRAVWLAALAEIGMSRSIVSAAGIMFAVYAAALLATGFWTSRYEGKEGGFGGQYLVGGLGGGGTPFAFFIVLGLQVKGLITRVPNLVRAAIVAVCVVGFSLTGGREFGIWIFVLFLVGVRLARRGSRKNLGVAAGVGIPVLIVSFFAIGQVRQLPQFASGGLEDRLEAVSSALEEPASPGRDTAFQALVRRAFEFPGQVVVDATVLSPPYAGFEHFDRLPYAFVPKFIVPDKLPLNDASEVLARDYGYRTTEYFAVPITLVADAFRRGGVPWVIAVGGFVGGAVTLVASVASAVLPLEFAIMALSILALNALRLYTPSALGVVEVVTYRYLKVIVLFGVLALATRVVQGLGKSASSGRRLV